MRAQHTQRYLAALASSIGAEALGAGSAAGVAAPGGTTRGGVLLAPPPVFPASLQPVMASKAALKNTNAAALTSQADEAAW
jgi:hypothetical protein